MKKYSILLIVLYCLCECSAECSEYYVVLQRTNLTTYEPADLNHITDLFSHPNNISKEHQELRENKDCILTKDVRVNECYDSEPVCHAKFAYTVRKQLTGVNSPKPIIGQIPQTKPDGVNNADETGIIPNKDGGVDSKKTPIEDKKTDNVNIADKIEMTPEKDVDSKKRAIIVTSVGVGSGVLMVAGKLIWNFMHKGAYYLTEPNTTV